MECRAARFHLAQVLTTLLPRRHDGHFFGMKPENEVLVRASRDQRGLDVLFFQRALGCQRLVHNTNSETRETKLQNVKCTMSHFN